MEGVSSKFRGSMATPSCPARCWCSGLRHATSTTWSVNGRHFAHCVSDRTTQSAVQAFTVDIYSVGKEGGKGEKEEVCHVGRTSILPQHLRDLSGRLVLTVLSPQLLPMGTITCEPLGREGREGSHYLTQ